MALARFEAMLECDTCFGRMFFYLPLEEEEDDNHDDVDIKTLECDTFSLMMVIMIMNRYVTPTWEANTFQTTSK